MKTDARSLVEMASGAILERVDYETARVMNNIMDPNTNPTAKRKITVSIELKPDDTRQNVSVSYNVKSALAPTNPVTTNLFVADEDTVVEMVPQIPGQTAMDGDFQESPPTLKIVKLA